MGNETDAERTPVYVIFETFPVAAERLQRTSDRTGVKEKQIGALMKQKRFILLWMAAMLLAAVIASAAFADETEEQYVENEWNFVDGSMDISQGIPENATGVLGTIKRSRRLRVATDPYFAPQEFIDPSKIGQNRFEGADIELARVIADRMGVTLEIIPMDFSEVLLSLDDNAADLVISALAYVPSRAAAYELSKGYYYSEDNVGSSIVIRSKDQDIYHDIEDFSGKVIAAEGSSLQESLMAENFPAYKEFIRFKSLQKVFDAVESGMADAVMVNTEVAQSYIEKNPGKGLMLMPDISFELEEYYQGDRIAAKKGQLQLMYFVNGVIDEVLASGQYLEWYREAEELADRLGL